MAATSPPGQVPLSQLGLWLEHAASPMAIIEGPMHWVMNVNPAFCRLVNKAREDIVGKSLGAFLPENDECLALLDTVYHSGEPAPLPGQIHGNLHPVFSSYVVWPVKEDGQTLGVVIQVTETASLQKKMIEMNEALLLGSLHQHELTTAADEANLRLQEEIVQRVQSERDALMLTKEISHRIKNNLQNIIALIANEVRKTPPQLAQGYASMEARISAIAALYDLISQSDQDDAVRLDAYLRELAKTISACLLEPSSAISIEVKASAVEIVSERAVPFGLIVNELSTNAIKHAFPDGVGRITLSIEQVGDQVELIVADDGVGIAEKKPAETAGRHGADYVAVFVRQLGGTMTVSRSVRAGTTVSIQFPLRSGS